MVQGYIDKEQASEMTAFEVIGAVGNLSASVGANLYHAWLDGHANDPLAYVVAFNLGVLQKEIGALDDAETSYRLAIQLNPSCHEAQFNLGSQLEQLGRPNEAIDQWLGMIESGLLSQPKDEKIYLLALNNLGRLLEIQREYDRAEDMLLKSLLIQPQQPDVIQHYVYLRQKQCKWPVYPEIRGLTTEDMMRASGPLSILALSDNLADHLDRMRRYAQEKIAAPKYLLTDRDTYSHTRIRVGYLSSDFCLHPVSMLMVELFELHDRNSFEIFGFSWSRDDGSALRKRVVNSLDHYISIAALDDESAARLIRSCEIDILVDLHGLTLGARPGILSWRPAPVQMTYLGFPGTTGIPGIDYVIADRYLIPEASAKYFSEQPIYLEHCFQVSDRKRPIGEQPNRTDLGLPEDVMVYCSFNNNYKITPEVFRSWLAILSRVEGSVLWLLADNSIAQRSLIEQAEASGIASNRLIFAPRATPHDYLARYPLADLFLDTFPFGAGTTANDALWMGVPLLTRPGNTFASRMAASLLNTLGIHELIASSEDQYIETAVELGRDKERLSSLKAYLRQRIKHSKLFKVPEIVESIESAYKKLVSELRANKKIQNLPFNYNAAKASGGKFSENYSRRRNKRKIIIEVVSATRMREEEFWVNAPLGQSLLRLANFTELKPVILFENSEALSVIYNQRINSTDPSDILLFVHDDVWITDYFLEERILCGLQGYDVIGVAGSRWKYDEQPSWVYINNKLELDLPENLSGFVAHGPEALGEVTTFGDVPADCELLDGVFLAAWKRTLKNNAVYFDPQFRFHFYDLDFCRTARSKGLRLGTWPICITHQSEGSYDNDEWRRSYLVYLNKLSQSSQ